MAGPAVVVTVAAIGVVLLVAGVVFRRRAERLVAFEAATIGGDYPEGPAERAGWIRVAGGVLIAGGGLAVVAAVVLAVV
jgi:hypothetical protein